MQRVAEPEHHVVGDVDDVRDRALARRVQPRAQPHRRRRDRHVLEQPADVARAAVEVVDADRTCRVGPGPMASAPGGGASVEVVERRDLARDAVDRLQVGPVAGRLDEQDVVDERQYVGERRPGSASCSSMIPPCSVPRPTSSSARIIPSETSPRTLRRSSCSPFGSTEPGQRDADGGADAEVPRPADDLARLALADVDLRHLEPVGVRVLLRPRARGRRGRGRGCRRRRQRRGARSPRSPRSRSRAASRAPRAACRSRRSRAAS